MDVFHQNQAAPSPVQLGFEHLIFCISVPLRKHLPHCASLINLSQVLWVSRLLFLPEKWSNHLYKYITRDIASGPFWISQKSRNWALHQPLSPAPQPGGDESVCKIKFTPPWETQAFVQKHLSEQKQNHPKLNCTQVLKKGGRARKEQTGLDMRDLGRKGPSHRDTHKLRSQERDWCSIFCRVARFLSGRCCLSPSWAEVAVGAVLSPAPSTEKHLSAKKAPQTNCKPLQKQDQGHLCP